MSSSLPRLDDRHNFVKPIIKSAHSHPAFPDQRQSANYQTQPLMNDNFCQSKITELWHLLMSDLVRSKVTFHIDLWLPPNENQFTIDFNQSKLSNVDGVYSTV